MVLPLPRAVAAVAVGCVLAAPTSLDSQGTFDAGAFLRTYAGFSSQDVARAAAGTGVARSLQADADEVAISGAIFIAVSRQHFLERFRDIVAFKRNPLVIAIGRFSSQPSAADMRELKLDEDDVSGLKDCRPGDCDLRLDGAGIARLHDVSIRDGGSDEHVSAALREHLAAYVADYLNRGDAALMQYHDDAHPRRLVHDLSLILKRSPYFDRELAAMRQDAVHFGGLAKSTNENMLYWSSEKIAGIPVITLTHAVIVTPATGVTGIATRQLYASHFFHASLGLTVVVDANGPHGPGVMIVYLNRSRTDAFSGILGPVKRAAVRSRARGTAERLLNGLKARLEKK
jgi:hypothetical protein